MKVKHIPAAFKHPFYSLQQFAILWVLRKPPDNKGLDYIVTCVDTE